MPTPLADTGSDVEFDIALDRVDPDADPDWAQWGTSGSVDGVAQSPRGNALCGLSDIRTDDLDGDYSVLVPEGTWSSSPVDDDPSRCGDDDETTLWRLTNCERLSRNIEPLECDLRLVWVGRQHSQDMIDRDYWGHESPEGVTPFERMADRGITFTWAGENIANYPDLEDLHWGWMDSTAGHRDNILLGSFSHVGIGIVKSGSSYMATQDFIGL